MSSRSEQQELEKGEIRRRASRYILEKLGDRLWAGEPTYDERSKEWKVNIHSRSLPSNVALGEITLDAYGDVVRAPSRQALQSEFQRREPEAIGKELLADPDMKMAYCYLKLALADQQMRRNVLTALETFARAVLVSTAASSSLLRATFAPTRIAAEGQEPLELPKLPDDPKAIGEELLADPDMKTAYRYLKSALSDQQMRQSVLVELEAWARAARKDET